MSGKDCLMVVFSATYIDDKMIDKAIDTSKEYGSDILVVNIRDKNVVSSVSEIVKNQGFLGKDMVSDLEKDMKRDRDSLIEKKLSSFEKKMKSNGIDYEILRKKGNLFETVARLLEERDIDRLLIGSNYRDKIKGLKDDKGLDIIFV